MDWKTIIALVALIFSAVSLFINIYKDFIQGPRFKAALNTIVVLKLEDNLKRRLEIEMLTDNVFANDHFDLIQTAFVEFPQLFTFKKNNDRKGVQDIISMYVQSHIDSNQNFNLVAREDLVDRYIGHEYFQISFYLPINIINHGRRPGEISSILMKVWRHDNISEVWYYNCFSEIDHNEFFKNTKEQIATHEHSKRVFPGLTVPANSIQRLDCLMLNSNEIFKKELTQKKLSKGKYHFQIIGYNSSNKQCLKSNINWLELDTNIFRHSFNGNISIRLLSFKEHMELDFKKK